MEPKDYVIRVIKRMIQFLAKIYGLLDEKKYALAEESVSEKLIELSGLPKELIESADSVVLDYTLGITPDIDHEKIFWMAKLYFLKGYAREQGGDPITAYRYYQCSNQFFSRVDVSKLDEKLSSTALELQTQLPRKVRGVEL
jgi:hypothetical protein